MRRPAALWGALCGRARARAPRAAWVRRAGLRIDEVWSSLHLHSWSQIVRLHLDVVSCKNYATDKRLSPPKRTFVPFHRSRRWGTDLKIMKKDRN